MTNVWNSPASPSAFPWPNLCSLSAGFSDFRMEKRFTEDVIMSRNESTAEASMLIEFVSIPTTTFYHYQREGYNY